MPVATVVMSIAMVPVGIAVSVMPVMAVLAVPEVVVVVHAFAVHSMTPIMVVVVVFATQPHKQEQAEGGGRAKRRQKLHGFSLNVPEAAGVCAAGK